MITRDQAEDSVRKIGETDHAYAEAKTEVERATWLCKHTRAIAYEMTDRESKVDERKNAVERSEIVVGAEERRIKAVLAFETIKAQRETQALLIEVWRSVEATRRRETVT
jgi:hypothetical protein